MSHTPDRSSPQPPVADRPDARSTDRQRRHLTRLGAGLLGLTAAGIGGWLWQRQQLSPAAQALWAAEFQQLDGGQLRMAAFKGRPLLLNFWATWCPPCVKELPELALFQKEHPHWRVVTLAVDQADAVRRFLQQHPMQLPLGLAGLTGLELGRTLGNSQGGLPFSVALDTRGELVWRHAGATDAAQLRALAPQWAPKPT